MRSFSSGSVPFQLNDDAWPNIFPISLEALIEIWSRSSGGFARGLAEVGRATHEICEFIPLTATTCVPLSKELLLQTLQICTSADSQFKAVCIPLLSGEVECSTAKSDVNMKYSALEMY